MDTGLSLGILGHTERGKRSSRKWEQDPLRYVSVCVLGANWMWAFLSGLPTRQFFLGCFIHHRCFTCNIFPSTLGFYYPPEVSSMKYCCLGVFTKEYFRLVTNWCK